MNKNITNKVLKILTESDKAYIRLLREYGVIEHTPASGVKVRRYIKDIKDTTFEDITKLVQSEKDALINAARIKPAARDIAQEMKRNSELILMKSAIEGSNNDQLVDIANKYANTEYQEDFRIMVQARIKSLAEEKGIASFKNNELINDIIAAIDKVPDEVAKEVSQVEGIVEEIRSLLYFSDKNFNMAAKANEEGHITHGSWNTRNINFDISSADEHFNPLGDDIHVNPLVETEKVGLKYYKTIKYQYDWE